MRALVTGATGFLGRHLVQRLMAGGHAVRGLYRSPAKRAVLDELGAEAVRGDLGEPESLLAATQGIDVVFHAAALVTHWAPWAEFERVTVGGTTSLLAACARAGVRRFVHISTIRVYDDRHCARHRVVTEEAPVGPRGFRAFGHYARAKVLAEQAVRAAHHCGEVGATILRPAWIYGPGDETILPAVLAFLASPGARWPGRHDPCADPIYVTDVADCALAAALAERAAGEVYNVAPAEETTVRQFLGAVCAPLGIAPPRRCVPYPLAALAARVAEGWAHLTRQRTPPALTRAGLAILTCDVRHDPGKALRELGWRSQVSLAEGATRTASWMKTLQ
jgi:nucleoside-diphosphate-sugar epimerase